MENGHLQRAQLLLEQRRFDLAQVELRRLLAEDPDHGPALALLALCRLNLGDVLQARQLAEQAIGAAADQAFTYYVMSVIQAERVRLADAVRQVKRAIELDPADADYHGFLAAIYVALNRPEEAIDAARDKTVVVPSPFTARDELYRFLLPGADVRRIKTKRLAEALDDERNELIIIPVPLDAPTTLPGFRLLGTRLTLNDYFTAEQTNDLLRGDIARHLFVRELLVEREKAAPSGPADQ